MFPDIIELFVVTLQFSPRLLDSSFYLSKIRQSIISRMGRDIDIIFSRVGSGITTHLFANKAGSV